MWTSMYIVQCTCILYSVYCKGINWIFEKYEMRPICVFWLWLWYKYICTVWISWEKIHGKWVHKGSLGSGRVCGIHIWIYFIWCGMGPCNKGPCHFRMWYTVGWKTIVSELIACLSCGLPGMEPKAARDLKQQFCRLKQQSWARNIPAAATWPWFQATQLLFIALCFYSLWLLYLKTQTLKFFIFFLELCYVVAMSHCREAKTLSRAQLCKIVSTVKTTVAKICRELYTVTTVLL